MRHVYREFCDYMQARKQALDVHGHLQAISRHEPVVFESRGLGLASCNYCHILAIASLLIKVSSPPSATPIVTMLAARALSPPYPTNWLVDSKASFHTTHTTIPLFH
jgi:hypothetical protein